MGKNEMPMGIYMRKKFYWILFCFIIIIGVTVFASTDDPLVSLSYLNDVFMPKVEKQIFDNTVFSIIELKSGDKFVGGSGCEFILRAGKATAIVSKNGGISDTTGGIDLKEKDIIPQNHLLIIPRDDGRGFLASSNIVIMVRGKYSITK
jgi:hypothetical protein